ncbi:pyridoxal phosphate-dependent transferase [Scenedesmus sp. NREL 46B-D3]|nr:pyridoxal phosphate-dependent transferase [Scenedesmus sp. NREL 46B-D3]
MQAGFQQQQPLSEKEWQLLPVLMAGRLMQSTLIGTYTISREPSNAAYVMPDERERWRCLNLLLGCPPHEMAAKLRAAAEASMQQAAGSAAAGDGDDTQSDDVMVQQQQGPLVPTKMRRSLPFKLPPFKLELYLARYEHLPLQLSRSSCQPVGLQALLAMADGDLQQQWQQLTLGYPPNVGSLRLRQEVALLYPGTRPDHVLCCVPNEGIFVAMAALLSPGDVVVAMHPAYQSLLEVARSMGATVKLWSMEFEKATGQPFFSLAALRKLMTADVKCLLINLPHNPSGWLPSRQQWGDIVDCARQVNAWLFSDELYRLLEQQPEQQRLQPAVCAYPARGISLGGLSKAFGLQGLRSGWLVCQDTAFLQQAECVKSYITTTGPIMSELLAVVALRNQQQLVGRCVGVIRDNLAAAAHFFDRWPRVFQWTPPTAGSLCLPRLVTGEPIDAFCARAAAGCGVVLLPGTVYDHAAAAAGQHFRLGLGRTNFEEALHALEQWLQSQQ